MREEVSDDATKRAPWFDRRLSVGNLITIGVVIAGALAGWFKFENRLSLLETGRANDQETAVERRTVDNAAIARLEMRITGLERERNDLSGRVIRIEEQLVAQKDILQRILRNVETFPRQ